MNRSTWGGIAVVLGLVGGCVTTSAPPPAVVDISQRSCDNHFAADRPLVVPDDGKPLSLKFDDTTACYRLADGTQAVYRLVMLPPNSEDRTLTVSIGIAGPALMAPHLILLQADLAPDRELASDAFLFRGNQLTGALRVHASDRYLLVRSDTARVGVSSTRIQSTVTATMAATGTLMIPISYGADTAQTLTYSHHGTVLVSLSPSAKSQP